MVIVLLTVIVSLSLTISSSAIIPGIYEGIGPVLLPDKSQCSGTDNVIPPWTGVPQMVDKVPHGALFKIETDTSTLHIMHVSGTPYEMGYAHGKLLTKEIKIILDNFDKHLVQEGETLLPKINSNWLKKAEDFLVNQTINELLDLTYDATSIFFVKAAPYWEQELQGLSDASGVNIIELRRMHMIPELFKAKCSMVGGWGEAVKEKDQLYQLRALDWDTDGGLQDFPMVMVYHPNKGNGHAFSTLTWPGLIGAVTGMSSAGLAISEIGADIPFGAESRIGYPFFFLLRDILQFDEKREDALERMKKSNRTCSIWVGVGDRNEMAFNITQYSYSTCNVLDDVTVAKVDPKRMEREGCSGDCITNYYAENVAYWGIHLGCWQEEIAKNKKDISVASIIRMVGRVKTGNLHIAVYDHKEFKMYVANARAGTAAADVSMVEDNNAYNQQFIELDMPSLFKYAN